jgi:predicted RNase H-like HicB family nuclease
MSYVTREEAVKMIKEALDVWLIKV